MGRLFQRRIYGMSRAFSLALGVLPVGRGKAFTKKMKDKLRDEVKKEKEKKDKKDK